jgi:hypothetical protein
MTAMNCAAFDRLASDLSEGRLEPNALRDEALAHAAACARCARRFDEENALSADLRAFAVATEACETPERIGEDLLMAFRRGLTGPAPVSAPLRPLKGRSWLWGAAAAMLLAGTLIAVRESRRGEPARPPSPPSKTAVAEGVASMAPFAPVHSPKPAPRAATRRAAPTVRAPVARIEPARAEVDEEEAAEFVPLQAGDALGDVESVQLVRVQLSPSAVAALGWTESEEAAGRRFSTDLRVSADLVVGQDGVARAIRFVH